MVEKALAPERRLGGEGLRRLSMSGGQLGGWNDFRSVQYRWEPEADTVCTAPLVDWEEDDLEMLFSLLWRATSQIERGLLVWSVNTTT